MTAPFPTRKQEEWRYADLDAMQPVWEQFAEPVTLTVGPGECFEKVWLPTADVVQVRRVQIALERGAKGRLFVLNVDPSRAPGPGSPVMNVIYAAIHQLDGSGCSIPDQDTDVVALGAYGYACLQYGTPLADT